jgi:flavin reductase (DIM6/NTAB) family NADH-FMN oxidoreductase RutF
MTLQAGGTPAPPGTPATTDGEAALHKLAAGLDPPMVIVTALAPDGRRSGCLVGFSTQCSIHPPRVLACISKANHTFAVATAAPVLAVHFLGDDDRGLAELFGGETGDEVDKFERCSWRPGPNGVPVLDGVKGWVAGAVAGRFDVGDHVAFVVEAEAGGYEEAADGQLGFQAVKDVEPGHDA